MKFPDSPNGKIIILGATSAIAQASARLLAGSGASLLLVGRNAEQLREIQSDLRLHSENDVLVEAIDLVAATNKAADFAGFCETLGGCDGVLIFYGTLGDQEQANSDPMVVRDILETNFTSVAEWVTLAVNALEQSPVQHPALVCVSSVAGDRGRRSNYAYGAAKGGLSIFIQGIAHRFAQHKKLRIINMKLGFVKTPMTEHLDQSGPLWASPEQIARSISKAIRKGGPNIYAPFFWRWIMLVIRALPVSIFNRVNL